LLLFLVSGIAKTVHKLCALLAQSNEAKCKTDDDEMKFSSYASKSLNVNEDKIGQAPGLF